MPRRNILRPPSWPPKAAPGSRDHPDAKFVEFEAKCDAGHLWKWRVTIVEKLGEEQMGEFVESPMFNVSITDGAHLLRDVLMKAAKMISKQAADTISGGDDVNRIIVP